MPLPITLYTPNDTIPDNTLARMVFGPTSGGGIAHTGLQPLCRDTATETWGEHAPTASGTDGDIHWAQDAHCLIGHVTVPLDGDTRAITWQLYRQLLVFVARSDFPCLLRIWNYLPRINTGDGDGELYRRFCIGRAQAFDEHPLPPDQLPAGTAIGSRDGNELLVYFIATRDPGTQIENPRQTSAFQYPRAYSPRKPLFSRARVWSDSRDSKLIVSGTASIVGHISRHEGDLAGQLAETWRNLEALRSAAGATRPLALRVYIRNERDYPAVKAFLTEYLPAHVHTLYLLADICRAELLVEIEGVYAMPATA